MFFLQLAKSSNNKSYTVPVFPFAKRKIHLEIVFAGIPFGENEF